MVSDQRLLKRHRRADVSVRRLLCRHMIDRLYAAGVRVGG